MMLIHEIHVFEMNFICMILAVKKNSTTKIISSRKRLPLQRMWDKLKKKQ